MTEEETTKRVSWTQHLKAHAKEHGQSYKQAMQDTKSSETWTAYKTSLIKGAHPEKPTKPKRKRVVRKKPTPPPTETLTAPPTE
tara:strand:- start:235 stop:486 length:252 start_codon:yes stop_codon:yes gene_type:complete